MTSERKDIDIRIDELGASFPAVHEASDCLAFVRRFGKVLWDIFHQDDSPKPDGSSPKEGTYTIGDARALAAQLKGIAAVHESIRVLDKQGVVRHLADDIRALGHRDFTLGWIAETLTGLGFEVTEDTLFQWLYPPPPV